MKWLRDWWLRRTAVADEPLPPRPPVPPRPMYPAAYDREAPGADVFDPALRHYRAALRKGDPPFADAEMRRAWARAREQTLTDIVARVARSDLRDHLVLRGGLLTRAWFGARARDPKDVDWVVAPATMPADSSNAASLLGRVASLVREGADAGPFVLCADAISLEAIWTYERAEGRRLVVPFEPGGELRGLPGGCVQLDFVFGEMLRDSTCEVVLRAAEGGGYRDAGDEVRITAASMRESLAWKVLWLITDMSPQGKDLYDAVLLADALAERGELSDARRVIADVLAAADLRVHDWNRDLASRLDVADGEWRHLIADYPQLAHLDPASLRERLIAALAG